MCQSASDKTQTLTTLYQANRYNQDLYMRQQWKIFYFTMVAHSVIFYLCKDGGPLLNEKGVLIFGSFFLMFISLYVLWSLECSLEETQSIDLNLRKETDLESINTVLKNSGVDIEKDPQKGDVFWILWFLDIGAFCLLAALIFNPKFSYHFAIILTFLFCFVSMKFLPKCKNKK